ncbi:MAG: hypothetical protein Q8M15_10600 [Bacteroidota bacterium]|nr:hypothetical protein [Bacteroidota bacterium]
MPARFIHAIIIVSYLVFMSCGQGDDGPQIDYSYYGVIKCADTNEIIKRIYYPDASISDSPNTYRAKLKLSTNFPTHVLVQSTSYNYDFTFNLKFTIKYSGDVERNSYTQTFEGLEILNSNAKEIQVRRYEIPNYSQGGLNGGYHYLLIDTINIK